MDELFTMAVICGTVLAIFAALARLLAGPRPKVIDPVENEWWWRIR